MIFHSVRGPLISIDYTIDETALAEHIASWIPESLSPAYAGLPEEEAAAMRDRLRKQAHDYIVSSLGERAHHILRGAIGVVVESLQQEARAHALRMEVGDTVAIDDMQRYTRDAVRDAAEALPQQWVPRQRGRRRQRGTQDVAADRERLKAEMKKRKNELKARGERALRDDVLSSIARDRNVSESSLDALLYPRRSPKRV